MKTEAPKELQFGTEVEGKANAVFVALTVESDIYRDYEDPKMTPEYRAEFFPLVLMVERWDGKTGFVGGFQEPGQTFADTAKAELLEEVGINPDNFFGERLILQPSCTHELPKIVVHLFKAALGRRPISTLRSVLAIASMAPHSIAEGCAKWAHLKDYGKSKGVETLLASNVLASAVKEELETLFRA